MAGNTAGKGELLEQPPHPLNIQADIRIHLGVAALQVRVGHQGRSTMAGTDDCEYVAIPGNNDSIQMRVDEIDARRRSPVTQQPRLDVLERERLAQQRIVEQVDLAGGQVIGRSPPGMDTLQLGGGQWLGLRFTYIGHRVPHQLAKARKEARCVAQNIPIGLVRS